MMRTERTTREPPQQFPDDTDVSPIVPAVSRVIIDPPRGWQALDVRELWRFRELLYFLAWRDVKVRYKQTALGVAWVVLQPFLTMVIFSIIFGRLMAVPTGGIPYPIFTFVALLPWNFFAGSLTRSGNSLIADANLLSKVYFPRLILPVASVLSMLVDFAISFVILIGMMLFYRITPGPAVFTLPVFLLLAFLTALGFGLWLSALNVKYRDISYLIPFIVQMWFFLTPVAYPITIIPAQWRFLYSLNPMTGVVEGFRWALLGQPGLPGVFIILSAIIVVVVFIGGLFYFRRMENEFADVV